MCIRVPGFLQTLSGMHAWLQTGEPLSKENPVPNHSLRSIIDSMFPGIAAKG